MSPAIAKAENYHDWVFGAFVGWLREGTTLEIGSGHGGFARKLARCCREVIVSDIDPDAIARIRAELDGSPNIRFQVMDGVDPSVLGGRVDNIVLLNVLEHIRDDVAFVTRCREALTPGGVLVTFVPAFPLLFSRMDREAGHFRRYTRRELVWRLERSALEVISIRYFNAVGFAGWLLNKVLDSGLSSATTNAQIRAYDRAVPLVKTVDKLMPFIGQSLLAVARVPAHD